MQTNNQLTGACIVGQSGGPTAVINASLYGVIKTALESPCITRVLGAAHGIRGVLDDVLYDMGLEDAGELEKLLYTPSSALGSCRYKIAAPEKDDTDYKRILEIFKKYDVRYFFYNGGNDSMDTCNKINRYMQSVGYDCRVIGVPKTIDNDLFGTDHSPGFASAAKYIATTFMEVALDATVYDTPMVTIVEVMGRNAGWLTAAAALAGTKGLGPDLVYLPECAFSMDAFLDDVERIYNQKKKVIVAVSEGIKDKDGKFISEYGSDLAAGKDAFGHAQMGGLALILSRYVKNRIDTKVRDIELSLLQRCAAHCASGADIQEAFMVGKTAVESAVSGSTGYMVAIQRTDSEKYEAYPQLVELDKVANFEQKVPLEWINAEKNGVTDEFIRYAAPLIELETGLQIESGLPCFARLKKIKA